MATASIKVLSNADALLHLLATHGAMSVADVARGMTIPRPSVYRLVDALVHAGWVNALPDGHVHLAPELLHLADAAKKQNPLVHAAEGPLRELRDSTGHTVYLCRRRDDEIVCLERYQGLGVGLLELVPGGVLPPNAGATSRVISAFDDELRAGLSTDAPFKALTQHTITTIDELEADARAIRERKYSISDGDVTIGVAAIGVPLWSSSGRLTGAISVAGLRDQVLTDVPAAVEALRATADAISR
jgi:DNA-binding IclR family transcriptional regulator